MRIGIDFDNTIANYEGVFYQAAVEKKLIPKNLETSKSSVRDYLRSIGKEKEWTMLQGYIYGNRMDLATVYPGLLDFLQLCKQKLVSVFIISHKTKFPYLGQKYDLHTAAKKWLSSYEELQEIPSYFEESLEKKLAQIAFLKCDYFIDDLPELLEEPIFPKTAKKILFDPHQIYPNKQAYQKLASWKELIDFFGL